ncbi:hypothetical protein RFI_21668 [Reticulomyxa filosa]|uniref:Uncharacterized protein n=1 Tax=Reticulomyxa filosa TaxID=46433 RepID=X6MRF2_RETFI|nr:hypothetical protein RFI_21668 [Reticulomyxa filosa]|eukprot:ETO15690.1 hypothetical protein RFI_21668 [Reticulomyxa filosa]
MQSPETYTQKEKEMSLKIKSLEDTIKTLKRTADNWREEIIALNEQLLKQKIQIQSLQNNNTTLTEQIDNLQNKSYKPLQCTKEHSFEKQEVLPLKQRITLFERECEELRQKNETLAQQLNQMDEQLKEKEEVIEKLKNDLALAQKQFESSTLQQQTLNEALQMLKMENTQCAQQIQQHKQEAEAKTKICKEKVAELTAAQQTLSRLREQYNKLEIECRSKERSNEEKWNDSQTHITKLQCENDRLLHFNHQMANTIEELKQKYKKTFEEKDGEHLGALEQVQERYDVELKQANEKIEEMQSEIEREKINHKQDLLQLVKEMNKWKQLHAEQLIMGQQQFGEVNCQPHWKEKTSCKSDNSNTLMSEHSEKEIKKQKKSTQLQIKRNIHQIKKTNAVTIMGRTMGTTKLSEAQLQWNACKKALELSQRKTQETSQELAVYQIQVEALKDQIKVLEIQSNEKYQNMEERLVATKKERDDMVQKMNSCDEELQKHKELYKKYKSDCARKNQYIATLKVKLTKTSTDLPVITEDVTNNNANDTRHVLTINELKNQIKHKDQLIEMLKKNCSDMTSEANESKTKCVELQNKLRSMKNDCQRQQIICKEWKTRYDQLAENKNIYAHANGDDIKKKRCNSNGSENETKEDILNDCKNNEKKWKEKLKQLQMDLNRKSKMLDFNEEKIHQQKTTNEDLQAQIDKLQKKVTVLSSKEQNAVKEKSQVSRQSQIVSAAFGSIHEKLSDTNNKLHLQIHQLHKQSNSHSKQTHGIHGGLNEIASIAKDFTLAEIQDLLSPHAKPYQDEDAQVTIVKGQELLDMLRIVNNICSYHNELTDVVLRLVNERVRLELIIQQMNYFADVDNKKNANTAINGVTIVQTDTQCQERGKHYPVPQQEMFESLKKQHQSNLNECYQLLHDLQQQTNPFGS